MDERNLVHPMTAGDLVVSVRILAASKRGDGVEMHLLEVTDVHQSDGDDRLTIDVQNEVTLERLTLRLKKTTPILASSIRL